jgi:hypothetical protein
MDTQRVSILLVLEIVQDLNSPLRKRAWGTFLGRRVDEVFSYLQGQQAGQGFSARN